MNTIKNYLYRFEFGCERKLTQEEKMEISAKGLNALHDIVYEAVGEAAHHNMSFGWGTDGDPYEKRYEIKNRRRVGEGEKDG